MASSSIPDPRSRISGERNGNCSDREDACVRGGREIRASAVQGRRPEPRRLGTQGDPARRARDARPDGAALALCGQTAAGGRPHHGQPPHDDPDRGADRNAHRAGRRRPLGVVQHLLDAGPRGRGRRRRPPRNRRHRRRAEGHAGVRVERRDARRVLVVHRGGARVARRRRPDADRRRRRRRDALRAQGGGVREGRRGARLQSGQGTGGVGRHPHNDLARAEGEPRALDDARRGHPRRQRGDDDRRPSPLPDDGSGHAAVPRDQRQRLGHQEQVRQHLRLPPLASRRSRARDRRHARRQGRRGLRLRRSGQGLRAGAARPGLPRDRHRDRSDLRAAGGDGRASRSTRSRT